MIKSGETGSKLAAERAAARSVSRPKLSQDCIGLSFSVIAFY